MIHHFSLFSLLKKHKQKHYLGMRWRIIPAFILILCISISIDTYFSFAKQDESIKLQQKQQSKSYINAFNGYLNHEAAKVHGIGQTFELMNNQRTHLTEITELEKFQNTINAHWLDVQMSLHLDGLLLIDNAENILLKKGHIEGDFPLTWTKETLELGIPIKNIFCKKECKLLVAIPHFSDGREVILITILNLATILQDLSTVFESEILLLNNFGHAEQDNQPVTNKENTLWNRDIIASNIDSKRLNILTKLQHKVSIDTLKDGQLIETSADDIDQYFWLKTVNILSTEKTVQARAITIMDISDQYQLTMAYLHKQVVIKLTLLAILAAFGWISLGSSLKRLVTLAQSLSLLASKDYLKFRNSLKGQSNYFLDEIDKLQDTSSELSYQLEDYQKQINEQNKELQYQALTDPLTKLGNRTLFLNQVRNELQHIDNDNKFIAVLFLDLDKFKNLNDSLGHNFGDLLLIEVGRRLKATLRQTDSVARIGGDEFSVLLTQLESIQMVEDIIEKIYKSFEDQVILGSHVWSIKSSIGAVTTNNSDIDENELLKMADIALYDAKNSGRNRFKIYNDSMQKELESFVRLENELRTALSTDQFVLFFQPIYDRTKNKIEKLEALIRWHHPEKGLLPAAAFIDTLERSEIMPKVGAWVIESAIKMAQKLQQTFSEHTRITINLSSIQFKDENLFDFITQCLHSHQVSPESIEIEVTESILMENMAYVSHQIQMLRNIGITVSLDDFGTGYSSLSYLKNLPIDVVKIDRSFILEIESNQTDLEIVQSIVNLCKSLNKKIVVEGVENEEQFRLLANLNIDFFQGYLLAKPMSDVNILELEPIKHPNKVNYAALA